jgi:protein-tyrosine phosphatase
MDLVDFHNHLIPGVDDGAANEAETLAALQAMHAGGVKTLVATPHVNASLTLSDASLAQRLAEIDEAWPVLQQAGAAVGVQVHRAAENALDVPNPHFAEPRLRLAGTRSVLVEFAFMTIPPQSAAVLASVLGGGWQPVLAHPERYMGLRPDFSQVHEWRRVGARLQVNGGSLTGRYGQTVQKTAWRLLELGLADYICSDYHARGRPMVEEYCAALSAADADEQRHLLTDVNPHRLLRDEAPLPVPPIRRSRSVWQRVRAIWQ